MAAVLYTAAACAGDLGVAGLFGTLYMLAKRVHAGRRAGGPVKVTPAPNRDGTRCKFNAGVMRRMR
jgi:hypothetical protein